MRKKMFTRWKRCLSLALALVLTLSMDTSAVLAAEMDQTNETTKTNEITKTSETAETALISERRDASTGEDTSVAVTINDENLRKAICNALNKEYTEGVTITENEMASLTELVAENAGITDLTGLKYAVNLEVLDVSGNDLFDTFSSGYAIEGLTKMRILDLSHCNLGGEKGQNYLYSTFNKMSELESLDLSGNGLSGVAYMGQNGDYYSMANWKKLKTINLSDNNYYGFVFAPTATFDSLERIDMTQNRIWADEASGAGDTKWYQTLVNSGFFDKVDFSNQKSLLELHGLWLEEDGTKSDFSNHFSAINYETNEIDLGSVIGNSVEFALSYYGEFGALNVQVVGTDTIKMIDDYCVSKQSNHGERTTVTLENLKDGENVFQLLLTHADGTTANWTVKVTSAAIPQDADDSAGIKDVELYKAVCTKLKKTYGETVTKEDMAQITGTLTATGVENAEGIQYATGAKTINISGDNLNEIPDLSNLSSGKLTTLTLRGNYTEVPGIENLTNITSLSLTGNEKYKLGALMTGTYCPGSFGTPDLSGMKSLNKLELSSNAMEKAVTISRDDKALSSLSVTPAVDGSLPEITGWSIDTLILVNPDSEEIGQYIRNANVRLLKLANLRGEVDLTGLDLGSSTQFYGTIQIAADCSEADTIVKIGGLTSTQSRSKELTAGFYSTGDYSLHLSGEIEGDCEISFVGGNIALDDGFSVPNATSISFEDGSVMTSELPDSFSNMQKLTRLKISAAKLYQSEIPSNFNDCKKLESISLGSLSGCVFAEDTDWSGCDSLTTLEITSSGELLPEGRILPESLESLKLLQNDSEDIEELYSANLPNLKSLSLNNNNIKVFPTELIQNLQALETLDLGANLYADIDADAFDNSFNLKTVVLGSMMKVVYENGSLVPAQGTNAAVAIETLKRNCPQVTLNIAGYSGSGSYSGLKDIESSTGSLQGNPYTETQLSIYVPLGTNEITITPYGIYDDTTISVDGKTYKSGEPIELKLTSFSQSYILTAHNDFVNYANLPTETEYVLNIIQGQVMETFVPQDNGVYSIGYHLMLDGSDVKTSMADNYVTHNAEVRYHENADAGMKYEIRFTVSNAEWISDMKYKDITGEWKVAETVGEDMQNNTRTYRIYADDITGVIDISPYVVPMSKYPVCDMKFDLSYVVDITSTIGVDKADLNAAINKALALTEKNNVYTDNSYSAMLAALEEAQKIAELSAPTQTAVDNAKDVLQAAIDGLVVDQSKLADKTALKAAIDEAKALEKGNHTDTAWNALQEAIADAQSVYDTLEATQNEVDTAVKSLNTAVTLFNNSGEASDLDKNNLADGVYSVYVDMIKTNRTEKSMADNAINHTVKLEVINGEYYVTLDFKGLTIENRFGYLSRLSYYAEGYSYGAYGTVEGTQIPAQVLSTQKDSDGKDVIDQYNDADNLYPDLVKIKLVPQVLADEEGYVPLHVFVPIMESIAAGNGDQDVLMKIDWTTLKETTADDPDFQPQETEEQSPAVDVTDSVTGIRVTADKGVLPEGAELKITAITSGSIYENAATILADAGKKFKLYEIHFELNGEEIQSNGSVTVSYPVPAGYNAEKLVMYRVNDDGTKTLIKGSVQNGFYSIVTKHFSYYALVEKDSTITDAENTAQVEAANGNAGSNETDGNGAAGSGNSSNGKTIGSNPKTGDNTNMAVWILLVLSAGAVVVLTMKKRKTLGRK